MLDATLLDWVTTSWVYLVDHRHGTAHIMWPLPFQTRSQTPCHPSCVVSCWGLAWLTDRHRMLLWFMPGMVASQLGTSDPTPGTLNVRHWGGREMISIDTKKSLRILFYLDGKNNAYVTFSIVATIGWNIWVVCQLHTLLLICFIK